MLTPDSRTGTIFFTGLEVEHTVMYDKKTLFVVGVQPTTEVMKHVNNLDITHVYLGANQSFNLTTSNISDWFHLTKTLLEKGLYVTLDYDVSYAGLSEILSLMEFNNFIPMISVKLPSVKNYNSNATIKIDDVKMAETNPGVWTHRVSNLSRIDDEDHFTSWDEYTQDEKL